MAELRHGTLRTDDGTFLLCYFLGRDFSPGFGPENGGPVPGWTWKTKGMPVLDLILGGPFPRRRRRFREPIAPHCGTKQKALGLRRGSCSSSRVPLSG